jgi:hypothetical protein
LIFQVEKNYCYGKTYAQSVARTFGGQIRHDGSAHDWTTVNSIGSHCLANLLLLRFIFICRFGKEVKKIGAHKT